MVVDAPVFSVVGSQWETQSESPDFRYSTP